MPDAAALRGGVIFCMCRRRMARHRKLVRRPMTSQISELADFGWNAFFSSQLDIDELNAVTPVRVMAVHRDRIHVAGPGVDTLITPFADARRR